MADPDRVQERRGFERRNRRLSCEVAVLGKRHSAVVLDMSAQGLFLRTHVRPPPETELEVLVRRAGGETWTICARVARAGGDGRNAALLSSRGLGVVIVSAPQAFYDFVASLAD